MPLNVKKNYAFMPSPTGAPKLISRVSTRARLFNETFYRSKDQGDQANSIYVGIIEDLTLLPVEGICVTQNKILNPVEMIFANGMSVPAVSLFSLNLEWNQEIRIGVESGALVAKLYGIRWQIAGGPPDTLLATLGPVFKDRPFSSQQASFKLSAGPADFPPGAMLYLRPRTRRYTLVPTSYTDPETMIVYTGWEIGSLRALVNADAGAWIRMPIRGAGGEQPNGAEDYQDTGTDATQASAFAMTALRGGDGLPATPAGLNTGPDRTLVHLNYSELDDGQLGVLNQVFEWAGESSTIGSWQRYA